MTGLREPCLAELQSGVSHAFHLCNARLSESRFCARFCVGTCNAKRLGMFQKEWSDLWCLVNNAGNGFDPERGETVDEVVADYKRSGAKVLQYTHTTSDIAVVCLPDQRVIGIGDAHGPWACVLDEPLEHAQELGRCAAQIANLTLLDAASARKAAYADLASWISNGDLIVLSTDKQKQAFVDAFVELTLQK